VAYRILARERAMKWAVKVVTLKVELIYSLYFILLIANQPVLQVLLESAALFRYNGFHTSIAIALMTSQRLQSRDFDHV
jgi:hypothetical protein